MRVKPRGLKTSSGKGQRTVLPEILLPINDQLHLRDMRHAFTASGHAAWDARFVRIRDGLSAFGSAVELPRATGAPAIETPGRNTNRDRSASGRRRNCNRRAALLLRTQEGNFLWNCVSLIDGATVELIRSLGGSRGIVISHPHYYFT